MFFRTLLITFFSPFLLAATLYLEPPEDFSPSVEAAGCFIEYEDKVLMLHRQDDKPHGNTWAVPGGKLEKRETPQEAAIREVYEESKVALSRKEIKYAATVYIRNESGDCIFHMFTYKLPYRPTYVELRFKEHKGYTWVKPQEAVQMNLMSDEEECFNIIYGVTAFPAPSEASEGPHLVSQ